MIEYSDVYGAAGGYAVLASGNDEQTGAIGHAGGYAGLIAGGHTQNSNAYNFSHIIGQICAGGYVGELEPGSVAKVLDSADVGENGLLNGLLDVNDLLSLVNAFVPSVRNSVTTSIPCGGVVRAQAASGEVTVDDVSEESGKKTILYPARHGGWLRWPQRGRPDRGKQPRHVEGHGRRLHPQQLRRPNSVGRGCPNPLRFGARSTPAASPASWSPPLPQRRGV